MKFDSLDKVIRILLFIPIWGWVTSGLYRIFKYAQSKNVTTLIVGCLCIIPVVGFFVSIVDLVTTIIDDKVKVLAD